VSGRSRPVRRSARGRGRRRDPARPPPRRRGVARSGDRARVRWRNRRSRAGTVRRPAGRLAARAPVDDLPARSAGAAPRRARAADAARPRLTGSTVRACSASIQPKRCRRVVRRTPSDGRSGLQADEPDKRGTRFESIAGGRRSAAGRRAGFDRGRDDSLAGCGPRDSP